MRKMMKHLSILSLLVFMTISGVYGQQDVKTYELKKGNTLDFILLNTKEGKGEDIQQYFKEVFPVAEAAGYNRLSGLQVAGNPMEGNYHPAFIVPGFWDTHQSRPNFLEKILELKPDFYQTRRDIWSTFNLVCFDLQEDLSFSIHAEKYYTVTTIWLTDPSQSGTFVRDWNRKVGKAGGKNIVLLTGGHSPKGYFYTPELFVITEWEDEASPQKNSLADAMKGIRHIEQWMVK